MTKPYFQPAVNTNIKQRFPDGIAPYFKRYKKQIFCGSRSRHLQTDGNGICAGSANTVR